MVNPETGETQAQFAKRTQWWRDAKFGMFVHWGIYSVPNSDHANTDLSEWYLSLHKMQVADYEKYAAQFDPIGFDARAWVAAAKAAGMKYITVTTKHHDGFCMFDSKLTDYNVVKATPWHHDPIKDLAAECKKQGITLCFYYSVMDWHHPDYLPRRDWDTRPTTGASLDHYIDYLKGQLTELLTNYGPIGGIWFDGHWEHNAADLHALDVVKHIRSVQPSEMINDRINLPEDYATPEQTIPGGALPNGRLWETCMTINDHWGYAWNDANFKTTEDLVHKLCDIASKGGNFLLNVGPDKNGVIPAEEVTRLREIGDWMKGNGDSIYGTTASPFKRVSFDGRVTRKENTLYLQVFHWPDGDLRLEHLKTPVRSAESLVGRQRLPVKTLPDGTVTIGKPERLDPLAAVVAVHLAGPPQIDPASLLIQPLADGGYNLLAQDADIHGASLRTQVDDGVTNMGYWTDAKETASWTVTVPRERTGAASYHVALEYSCPPDSDGSTYDVVLDTGAGSPPQTLHGAVTATGSWDTYQTVTLDGTVSLPAGASQATVRIVPVTKPKFAVMNLRRIRLTPAP